LVFNHAGFLVLISPIRQFLSDKKRPAKLVILFSGQLFQKDTCQLSKQFAFLKICQMKKILLLTLVAGIFSFSNISAQTPLTEAVDFTVTTVEGETINLFTLLDNGQHVLIDFFFTTCGPCQQAAPHINEAYLALGCNEGDVYFIAMNYSNTDAQCIQFDETFGVEYPTVSGLEGGGDAVNSDYGISLYPTVILIAPNHDIIEQDIWPIPNAQAVITPILNAGCELMECPASVTAAFTSEVTEICEEGTVSFTDQSSGEINSWEWTFEGGDPATSTEENPVVVYHEAGIFDVELTVSNGSESNTIAMDDYITVHALPVVALEPFDMVCLQWPSFELEGGTPEGGEYAGPGVTDGWFDPSEAGAGTHEITYNYEDEFGCSNEAVQQIVVDPCTGMDENEKFGIKIYPNPTQGVFNLMIAESGNIQVKITGLLGNTVFQEENFFVLDGNYRINLKGLEPGIYIVTLHTENNRYTGKIKLMK
jgi:PKD repeat protein